ncbi:hypothetical protein PSHT_15177 [Puccinia striiformis]|uniref:Uncharacterized protein n=1 Tax=Puccinia striiformis TaxID=27350 RepID=A0A2S4UGJ5_9BASI|nr:hypothetical protein PSHT_15177 [Puccinia striiformis]
MTSKPQSKLIQLFNKQPAQNSFELVKELKTCFASGSYLILLHFVTIIPATNGFPTQNYYKDWFSSFYLEYPVDSSHK